MHLDGYTQQPAWVTQSPLWGIRAQVSQGRHRPRAHRSGAEPAGTPSEVAEATTDRSSPVFSSVEIKDEQLTYLMINVPE